MGLALEGGKEMFQIKRWIWVARPQWTQQMCSHAGAGFGSRFRWVPGRIEQISSANPLRSRCNKKRRDVGLQGVTISAQTNGGKEQTNKQTVEFYVYDSFKGHPQEDASSRSSGGVAVHDIQRHRGSVSQDLGLDFVQDHLGLSSISHRATSKWMVSLWLPLRSSPIRHRAPKKNMFSPKNPSLRARKLVVKGQPQKGYTAPLHLCTFAPKKQTPIKPNLRGR